MITTTKRQYRSGSSGNSVNQCTKACDTVPDTLPKGEVSAVAGQASMLLDMADLRNLLVAHSDNYGDNRATTQWRIAWSRRVTVEYFAKRLFCRHGDKALKSDATALWGKNEQPTTGAR